MQPEPAPAKKSGSWILYAVIIIAVLYFLYAYISKLLYTAKVNRFLKAELEHAKANYEHQVKLNEFQAVGAYPYTRPALAEILITLDNLAKVGGLSGWNWTMSGTVKKSWMGHAGNKEAFLNAWESYLKDTIQAAAKGEDSAKWIITEIDKY